jgi:hypothetical protein
VLTAALLSVVVSVSAQGSLTPQDRAEIQALTAGYARALGACAAEEYADLKANGGHYEDVYVRTPEGSWRFKSRVHVADAPDRQ